MSARLGSTLALALILFSRPLGAAPEVASHVSLPPVATVTAVSPQQVNQAIAASSALFKEGDFAGGEAALFAANRHPAGTAAGSRDSGQALILMACRFRQEGDAATAAKLTQAGLAQLQQALLQASGNNKLTVNIYTLTGFAQERLCGAPAQAEASYQAALQISATAAPAAAAGLARLQAGDAAIASRTQQAGAN